MFNETFRAFLETLLIVFISGVITIILGYLINLFIFVKLNSGKKLFKLFSSLMKIFEEAASYTPFIAIMILLIPAVSQFTNSNNIFFVIIPVVAFTIPLFTALMFRDIQSTSIKIKEYFSAYGSNKYSLFTKIILPECKNNIIQSATKILIQIIGYSTIAGLVGGLGLGKIIYEHGFQKFNIDYLIASILILFVFTKLISWYGSLLTNNYKG